MVFKEDPQSQAMADLKAAQGKGQLLPGVDPQSQAMAVLKGEV